MIVKLKSFRQTASNSQKYLFSATGDAATFNPDPKNVNLILNEQVEEKELKEIENQGDLVSTIGSYTGPISETIAYLAVLLGFDSSGLFLKFSQMSKLLARFRVININYGAILTVYFN